MKELKIRLDHSVRITPIEGETHVSVSSNGDFLLTEYSNHANRPFQHRSVCLASTGCATLTRSAKGLVRTVKIILPQADASEQEFTEQLKQLFQVYNAKDI